MKTVLIVEDNENNLYMMRFIIDKLGHAVIEARDGAAGVAADTAADRAPGAWVRKASIRNNAIRKPVCGSGASGRSRAPWIAAW